MLYTDSPSRNAAFGWMRETGNSTIVMHVKFKPAGPLGRGHHPRDGWAIAANIHARSRYTWPCLANHLNVELH